MPGTRCTVAVCNNSLVKTKNAAVHIAYHTFPKDPDLRKVWIKKCHRDGKWNPDTCFVCSEHFREEDYIRDLQSELLKIPIKRKKLKPAAIPSLKLHVLVMQQEESTNSDPIQKRILESNNKKIVEELLKISKCQLLSAENSEIPRKIQIPKNNTEASFEIKYYQLLAKYEELKERFDNNVSSMQLVKDNIKNLEKALKSKSQKKNFHLKVREVFIGIFSNRQLDMILLKKRKVRWAAKDMATAYVLRQFSKPCYSYLRDDLNYPLPSITTLQRWESRLDEKHSILNDV